MISSSMSSLPSQSQSEKYSEKINSISQQFFPVLDDFKQYYVFFNKNPEVNEYQQFYLNNKTQLQNLNKDIFTTTNDIEKDIEQLNQLMTRLNIKLSDEKDLQNELNKLITNIQNTENGASTMLKDSVSTYSNQYYKNLQLLLGIFAISYFLSNLFKNTKK